MSSSELSRSIKAYIAADEALVKLRTTAKETRNNIKTLTHDISQAMVASDLNIVRVPSANCEIELKQKDTTKKESAAVKRVREVIEPLRGKPINAEIEAALLAAAAPPTNDDDEEDAGPQYFLKRRKLRQPKAKKDGDGDDDN